MIQTCMRQVYDAVICWEQSLFGGENKTETFFYDGFSPAKMYKTMIVPFSKKSRFRCTPLWPVLYPASKGLSIQPCSQTVSSSTSILAFVPLLLYISLTDLGSSVVTHWVFFRHLCILFFFPDHIAQLLIVKFAVDNQIEH